MRKLEVKDAFAQVVRELREHQNLSQQELADYSGIDRSFLSGLERGLHLPNLDIIYKLADVFEIKAHKLIEKVDHLLTRK